MTHADTCSEMGKQRVTVIVRDGLYYQLIIPSALLAFTPKNLLFKFNTSPAEIVLKTTAFD